MGEATCIMQALQVYSQASGKELTPFQKEQILIGAVQKWISRLLEGKGGKRGPKPGRKAAMPSYTRWFVLGFQKPSVMISIQSLQGFGGILTTERIRYMV